MDTLFEYLYVDHKRLNSYFEQISDSPVSYDKVPSWEGEAGITRLGGKYKSNVHPREFTTHEKCTKLVEWLEGSRQLNQFDHNDFRINRPSDIYFDHVGCKFHLARLVATKVVIRSQNHNAKSRVLCLWCSRPELDTPIEYGWYLLQDFRGYDRPDPSYTGMSIMSDFHSFWQVIKDYYIHLDEKSDGSQAVSDVPKPSESLFDRSNREVKITVKLLNEIWGEDQVRVSQPRRIETLYRCRHVSSYLNGCLIIGYPIFIVEAE